MLISNERTTTGYDVYHVEHSAIDSNPQQQPPSLALLNNMAMVQFSLNQPLHDEIARATAALERFRAEAVETHHDLVERVTQLELERPSFERRINETNRAAEAQKIEYERRIQNLEKELRATKNELNRERIKANDYNNAIEAIKVKVKALLDLCPPSNNNQVVALNYLRNFYTLREALFETCKTQLQNLKKI